MQVSKQQILDGFAKPAVTVLSFGLSQISDKTTTLEAVSDVKDLVNQIDVSTPPTEAEVEAAIFAMAHAGAALTPTKVDDGIVDATQLIASFISGDKGLIPTLIGLSKVKKASK